MRKSILLLALSILSGCSTYSVARYYISADNVAALRLLEVKGINVGEIKSKNPGLKEINCRGTEPLITPDGNTFAEYIRLALVDELQIANVYDRNAPCTLTGMLEKIDFDNMIGEWKIALIVYSSNGKSISVEENYKYKSSFSAVVACSQTAQALVPAVQNLLKKLVTNPEFPNLVK